jgi:BirA family transcriptional regulator, biotin operon repressor / biotin---[acetyl-CoA-carboxylase] ligase
VGCCTARISPKPPPSGVPDSLAPEVVEPLLRGRFGRPYRYAEVTPSTQRLLRPDDPEGAVAVAEEQTEGRGRLGRSWHAPARTSVLASIVLVPPVPRPQLPQLSLVAGDAVAAAIAAETNLTPTIKRPNDVFVDGRKVAGILAESSDGRVVLGVGVNANQTEEELPPDTQTPPTSLRVAGGRAVDRAPLLAAILLELERAYEAWVTDTAASG